MIQPAISRNLQAWLQFLLVILLSIDVTFLSQIFDPRMAHTVTAVIAITIAILQKLLGVYAQKFNTDGTPQAKAFVAAPPTPK